MAGIPFLEAWLLLTEAREARLVQLPVRLRVTAAQAVAEPAAMRHFAVLREEPEIIITMPVTALSGELEEARQEAEGQIRVREAAVPENTLFIALWVPEAREAQGMVQQAGLPSGGDILCEKVLRL